MPTTQPVADGPRGEPAGAHGRARRALDERRSGRRPRAATASLARGVLGGAERLHHRAGVDVDRAGPLAHPVAGAGLDGEVGVVALQRGEHR